MCPIIADPPVCPICRQIVCKDYKYCQHELASQREIAQAEETDSQDWLSDQEEEFLGDR